MSGHLIHVLGAGLLLAAVLASTVSHAQWTRVDDLPATETGAVFASGDALYVGGTGFVARLDPGSSTWQFSQAFPPEVELITALAVDGTRVYAGTVTTGVYVSTDGGSSFVEANTDLVGLGARAISDLAIRDGMLYAGTFGSGVFRSALGATPVWTAWNDGLSLNIAGGVFSLNAFGDVLVAGAGANGFVYRNVAGSSTWTAVEFGPFNPNGLSFLDGILHQGVVYGVASDGLYRSPDLGLTWERSPTGIGSIGDGAVAVVGDRVFALAVRPPNFLYEFVGDAWIGPDTVTGAGAYDLAAFDGRLYAAQFDGLWVTTVATSVEPVTPRAPARLLGNRPNPFNPRTAIEIVVAEEVHVVLTVVDVRGRRVRELVDEVLPPGTHDFVWDGADAAGTSVASGVYGVVLSAGGVEERRSMVLVR